MGQNILGQSGYRIFKSTISLEQNNKKPNFLHVDMDSQKIEVDQKNICVGVVKNGCGYSVLRTLKLAVCPGEMTKEIDFWYVDTNS